MASTVTTRWRARLATRKNLLARATATVAYWGRRAGSVRGRQALAAARAKRALRWSQVTEAQRVLARHGEGSVTSVSDAGVALVAGFEGFRSAPYRDAVGVWTIGYGETYRVGPNTPPWTRAKAATQLRVRLNRDYLSPVLAACKRVGFAPNQNEADALASLAYNLGPGVFGAGRTMGAALASRDRRQIANAFLVYDKAGGRSLPGLTRRRRLERALFLRPTGA